MRLNLSAGARMLPVTAVFVGSAIAASGCGANDAKQALDPSAQAEVVKAADVTGKQSRGTAMTITGTVSADGRNVSINGAGVADNKGRGNVTVRVASSGKTVKIDEILDRPVVYMRSAAFDAELPDGKSWLKLDLNAVAKEQGLDISTLSPAGAPQSPEQALDYLKSAGAAKRLGSEVVNAEKTTHYRVDVDLKKMAKRSSSPDASQTVEKLTKMIGSDTLPLDVWIDSKDHVRRERMHYGITQNGKQATIDITVDLTKFGVPVRITPPAADDTADLQDLLKNIGGQ